jgi:LPS-assembly lipoprotein
MSWPAKLRLGLAALAAAALGGCGFTPLYATPEVGPGLASIEVNVPKGRTAYLLGEDLNDYFARDRDKPANYRLDITIVEKRFARGLHLDNTADRYESHVIVNYSLVDKASKAVLVTGSEPVVVSYAASGQPYAGIAAQQDAQARAADQAAARIRTRLGVYFAGLAEK